MSVELLLYIKPAQIHLICLLDEQEIYGVVHRIASDGSEKGIGSFCIRWALEQCGHLRIDTHGDNTVMQGMLEKLGFTHCGTIYVYEDNDPRLAYEKIM